MAHSTNRSGRAPWDDWDDSRHGRPDDVPQGGLDDMASWQQDAEDFEVASSRLQNAGEAASEANESLDDTAEGQSPALARHSIDDNHWIDSNDQDGLTREEPLWPAMHSGHAPRHGEATGTTPLKLSIAPTTKSRPRWMTARLCTAARMRLGIAPLKTIKATRENLKIFATTTSRSWTTMRIT